MTDINSRCPQCGQKITSPDSQLTVASKLLNRHVGTDREILKELSDTIGVSVNILDKIMRLPQDYSPHSEPLMRVLFYFYHSAEYKI